MREAGHFVGVDLGGTNVKLVAVTSEGERLAQAQLPTEDTEFAGWAPLIRDQIADWDRLLGSRAGIGVASPGLVGSEHRSVAWMKGRMEAVCGFEWTEYLQSPSFVPVLNDGQAALLGETWLGAARGAENALLLTLGTGVGGAAIVDGRLLRGALGRAGHVGHLSLNPLGPCDIVGTPGSLEDLVGNATLGQRSGGRFLDTETLVTAARNGDALALKIWGDTIQALAAGLVSLINVLDPSVVILGGGISKAGEALFGPLADALEEVEWRPFDEGVSIVPALLGEQAGALGAARFSMTYRKENL